jgi:tRNA nucleotidyltransferase (CCA-adding enzyme)
VDARPTFPAKVDEALARLREADVRAYVVGGALRDLLLGREARDFDLLVESDLAFAKRVLPKAIEVSRHHPVLLLPPTEGGPRIEISGLRSGAHSLQGDLRCRDYTLNAIAFDPREGRYVDPLGGRADLASRRLRAVDCERGFRDDPVRILRGIRLALELELETDSATELGMQREAWRLHHSSPERVREDFLRLLQLNPPSTAVRRLRVVGALPAVLPELLREIGVAQNRYHPDDVFDHSLRVCDLIGRDPLLRLAALLHDAGKPESKCFSGKTSDSAFPRHEFRGVTHVNRVAMRLRLSKHEASRIERLVRHHLLFPDRLESDAAIRRMLRRAGRDILPDLLALRRADLASRNPQRIVPPDWKEVEARIRELEQSADRRSVPLAISGKEIMQELGITEGPEVGRWLRRARRRVTDRPRENEPQRLLAWLRETRERELK